MAERGGTITVTSSSDGATIVVTIADTGEGIEPDELERIFEPSSTMRATRFGAGLGLTVARAVVRNHGGSIAVESKRHRATTVRVALPVRTPSGVQPDDAKPRQAAPPRALRILLAEPDGEMLGMIKKLLVGAGNRVVDCGTPDAVLKALHEEAFDVVVADVAMPGLSGFDLHARLLAQWPELASRVVFTTARICDARTSAFVHSTGGRLVTKPFDVRDLLAAVVDAASGPEKHT
jgi:CheY-like chemotaxis protein